MRISIITVTFNSGKTVRDTIDSVMRQTYRDIEHIIVDGASKDNTMQIVKEMSPLYAGRLRYVSEPDKGIYDAMNKGIRMSTGDVVGILNSDDFFTSDDVIQNVADALAAEDVDAVYGDVHFVKGDNLKKCVRYYSSKRFRPWMLRFGFIPAHPSFYCRRSVYDKYGLYDLRYRTSADFDMMVRLLGENHIKTYYLSKDFVTMRMGGASTSGVASLKNVNKDIARSLKAHGIYSNQAFQALRYVWKVNELIFTKIKRV